MTRSDVPAPRVVLTENFLKGLKDLSPNEVKRSCNAILNLASVSKKRGLNLEPLRASSDSWWSIRVDKGNRIILWKDRATYHVYEFGRHDDAYARFRRTEYHPTGREPEVGTSGVLLQDSGDLATDASNLAAKRELTRKHESEVNELKEELRAAEELLTEAAVHQVGTDRIEELQTEVEERKAELAESHEEFARAKEKQREAAKNLQASLENEARILELNRSLQQEIETLEESLLEESHHRWSSEYPESWSRVRDFYYQRLVESLPPFQDIELSHGEPIFGSWGEIHHCRDLSTGAYCVVKLPRSCSSEDERRSRKVWDKEVQNSKLALREGLRGIARLRDIPRPENPGYLVFEGIEGDPLASLIAEKGAFSVGDILRVARDIADTVNRLLVRGVEFRDLHPGNVMVEGRRRVTIVDLSDCVPRRYCPPEWSDDVVGRPSSSAVGLAYCLGKITLEMFLDGRTELIGPVTTPDRPIDSSLDEVYGLASPPADVHWASIERALLERFRSEADFERHAERTSQAVVRDVFRIVLREVPEERFARPLAFVEALEEAIERSRA